MARHRYPKSRLGPELPEPAKVAQPRRIYWIVGALLAAGVVIGLLLGEDGAPRKPAAATAAKGSDTPDRDVGPSGGIFARGRRTPTASDVLGALRTAPGSALVRVEGRVLDAISRQPVGGVEVVYSATAGETTATADADGAYTIDVAPGSYRAFVRGDYVISVGPAPYERLPTAPDPTAASAPDDALAPMVAVNAPQRGVDLEVQRSGVVSGHVVDGQGRPVVGAVVRARTGPWRPVMGTDVAESGADGSFQLEVPAGFYALEAAHPDYAGPALDDTGQAPDVEVYPQMETAVTVTLVRGCIIEGRAIHADGTPVGAGALERKGPDEFFPAGPIADDGTFRYTSVVEGDVTIRAWPWKSPPTDPQTVHCADGVRQVVSFVLPDRAPDLTGRIVDASGAPQAGAYIDVYALTPDGMNQQERADAQGNWAVYALPAGEYQVTAHVPGQGVASQTVEVPGPDVELTLSGTGSLVGRVDGVADGETFQLTIGGCQSAGGPVVMQQLTQLVPVDGGQFRVDGLPACELMMIARSADRTQQVQADVTAGGEARVHIDLSPPRPKRVRVSVVDASGAAVGGAQIVVEHHDSAPSGDAITADGRGVATVDAHVGDVIRAYQLGPDGSAFGEIDVSDAPGDTEDVDIALSP